MLFQESNEQANKNAFTEFLFRLFLAVRYNETRTNFKFFSSWSFGILLWEVFTLGGSPYPGLPTEELFPFLEEGKRMDRPEICPKDVYEIMKSCWAKSPYDRPLFAHIVEGLSNVMKQNVPSVSQYIVLLSI